MQYQKNIVSLILPVHFPFSHVCTLQPGLFGQSVCLVHAANDDDMIREDKALFPEVYDEGC